MNPSLAVSVAFIGLVALMAIVLLVAVYVSARRLDEPPRLALRRTLSTAVVLGLWLAVTYVVAARGLLLGFSSVPPALLRLLAPTALGTIALAFSPFATRLGRGLPVFALVGFQSFRVLVEVILYALHREGVVPVQMTFAGLNFDVLTGLSAFLLWLLRRRLSSRALLVAWNVVGLLLLANIVIIANLSTPGPLRAFTTGPVNTIIARAPYVWLPTFLVQLALFGHILSLRQLRRACD